MTADNFQRIFDALLQQTPFHVFTVELQGGRRFEVDHPRAMVALLLARHGHGSARSRENWRSSTGSATLVSAGRQKADPEFCITKNAAIATPEGDLPPRIFAPASMCCRRLQYGVTRVYARCNNIRQDLRTRSRWSSAIW